jgi:hypothetical protein
MFLHGVLRPRQLIAETGQGVLFPRCCRASRLAAERHDAGQIARRRVVEAGWKEPIERSWAAASLQKTDFGLVDFGSACSSWVGRA